jgi:hypothetical protein
MNTILGASEAGRVRRRENWRHPGGESQMFEPLPRPESWNEARKASGAGKDVRRSGLLVRR